MSNMFAVNVSKFILTLSSMVVNFQLAWRIGQRKQLHTVFNLGYCFYFTLSGIVSIFLFNEYENLLTSWIESDLPNIRNCNWFAIWHFSCYLVYKVFLANLIFRYVIIKYSHYGMGKKGSLGDTNGWIIKLLYFIFLLSYGLMSYLGFLLKFAKTGTSLFLLKTKICMLEKSVFT